MKDLLNKSIIYYIKKKMNKMKNNQNYINKISN